MAVSEWTCATYDAQTPEVYVFAPALALKANESLKDGVTAPTVEAVVTANVGIAPTSTAAQLVSQINGWASGGSGSLSATQSGNTVTVTGTVTGAVNTLTLVIDSGVTVLWKADLTSTTSSLDTIRLSGAGKFELASGSITRDYVSGGGFALNAYGTNLTIYGGTISSNSSGAAVYINNSGTLTMTGGAVQSTGVNGMAISASSSTVAITGGEVKSNGYAFRSDAYSAIAYMHTIKTSGADDVTSEGLVVDVTATAPLPSAYIGTTTGMTLTNGSPLASAQWVNNSGRADILVTFNGGATKTIPMGLYLTVATAQTITPSTYDKTTPIVGELITYTNGTYTPNEGGAAGTHTYQWKRSDNADRTGSVTTLAETTKNYTTVSTDYGKYIWLETMPVGDGALTGIAVQGPVLHVGVKLIINITGTGGGTNPTINGSAAGTGVIVYTTAALSFTKTTATDSVLWTASPNVGSVSSPTSSSASYTPPSSPTSGIITLTATLTPFTTAVTLNTATADGTNNTTTSTKIDLVFSQTIVGLVANDITITDGTGAVVKGALTGSGTNWAAALTTVTTQGDISVAVASPTGYTISGSPKTVAVYKAVAPTAVTLNTATADGTNNTITSTKIDLVFSQAIVGLVANDITITDGTGAVVKGALTGSGTNWSIALNSVTTQGDISVAVANPTGYTISGSPKTVPVYKVVAPTAVTLNTATTDGTSSTTTSTKIDLVFSQAIVGLVANDITITDGTGAVAKGALTGSGTNWSIALTSVTTQGNVSVAITNPTGYTISGSPKTVPVYKAVAPTAVTLNTATADGTSSTTTSTKIDLVFSQAIVGLDDSNITITDGTGAVVKGALTGSGTNWSIALNSVTTQGDISVAVANPTGYTISGSPKTVAVYKAVALTGTVSISGTNAIGEMLTASYSAGNGTGTVGYQWKANGANISGANLNSYTLTGAEAGKAIICIVTYSNQSGNVSGNFDSSKTVPYNFTMVNNGWSGDNLSWSPTSGRVGDTITVSYVLANASTTNTLTFSDGTGLVNVMTAGASTSQNYTVNASDAVNGVITITATFLHTNLQAQTLTFPNGNRTVQIFDTPLPATLTKSQPTATGAITYSSGDTSVATVSKAILSLTDDERFLINELFLREKLKTKREITILTGIPQQTISYHQKKILKKLKVLLVKIKKSQQ